MIDNKFHDFQKDVDKLLSYGEFICKADMEMIRNLPHSYYVKYWRLSFKMKVQWWLISLLLSKANRMLIHQAIDNEAESQENMQDEYSLKKLRTIFTREMWR